MPLLGLLLVWALTALGLWVVTRLVRGVRARSTRALWLAALVLGVVNAVIRPILWWLTLPLTVLTLGLFTLVINALMLWLTAWLVRDFEIDGFGSALLAALVLALFGLAAQVLLHLLILGGIGSWPPPRRHGISM